MKKIILAVTVLALTAGITMGADMIAGNPKNGANVVGTVDVEVVGDNLVVTYTITDLDWIITETHLEIATDPGDFPTSKGGAVPGLFAYSTSHDVADNMQVVVHTIPLDEVFPPDGIVPELFYVAAHAVVGTLCPCDSAVCEELDLPTEVGLSVLWAGDFTPNRTESYFLATVFGGTVLDGDYDAYCVDTDRSIRPQGLGRGIPLQALVYCQCDDVPWLDPPDNPLIEYCDNFDLVVWILDNINVGDPSGCDGAYTMGDIQKAIWLLVDDTVDDSGLGDWSPCRVEEIIAAAEAEGEGFEPICGEYFGVILLPYVYMIDTTVPADGIPDVVLVDGTTGDPIYDNFPPDTVPILVYVQPIVIKIPAPCCFCDETAWAGTPMDPSPNWPDEDNDGYRYEFPGKDWSMYFSVPEEAVIAPPAAARGKK